MAKGNPEREQLFDRPAMVGDYGSEGRGAPDPPQAPSFVNIHLHHGLVRYYHDPTPWEELKLQIREGNRRLTAAISPDAAPAG